MNKVEYQNLKMKLHDKLIMFKIKNNLSDKEVNELVADCKKLI